MSEKLLVPVSFEFSYIVECDTLRMEEVSRESIPKEEAFLNVHGKDGAYIPDYFAGMLEEASLWYSNTGFRETEDVMFVCTDEVCMIWYEGYILSIGSKNGRVTVNEKEIEGSRSHGKAGFLYMGLCDEWDGECVHFCPTGNRWDIQMRDGKVLHDGEVLSECRFMDKVTARGMFQAVPGPLGKRPYIPW